MGIRINKYLSEKGLCSRREADVWVKKGRVFINGRPPEIGQQVGPKDVVKVDGRVVSDKYEDPIYLAFHKPIGIVTTTDTTEKDNIISYLLYPKRIFPIGRLDKDSEGLILMTSDGDIVNKILRSNNNHEKEYEVTVDKPITPEFIEKMANGVPILGTVTKKCTVEKVAAFTFRITLTQGLNRQIRRMCEHFGLIVTKLKRIRIMNVKLDVPAGEFRDLTEVELETIAYLTKDSKKNSSEGPKQGNEQKKRFHPKDRTKGEKKFGQALGSKNKPSKGGKKSVEAPKAKRRSGSTRSPKR